MLSVDFELTKKELEKELAENTALYRMALEASDNKTAYKIAITRTRLALKLSELSTSVNSTSKNPPNSTKMPSPSMFHFDYDV